MVTTLIVNASPLISLGKIDALRFMEHPSLSIHVPQPVVDEVLVQPHDTAARWVISGAVTREAARPADPILLAWDLGPGETAVIAEAHHRPAAIAVLDDLAARRCAQSLGIRRTGTLGLLLIAKRRGLIPAVMPMVDRLRESGLFIGDRLMLDIRSAADE